MITCTVIKMMREVEGIRQTTPKKDLVGLC